MIRTTHYTIAYLTCCTGDLCKLSPSIVSFPGLPWHRPVFDRLQCSCILQAIKNWTVGRPGNKASLSTHRHVLKSLHLHDYKTCNKSL